MTLRDRLKSHVTLFCSTSQALATVKFQTDVFPVQHLTVGWRLMRDRGDDSPFTLPRTLWRPRALTVLLSPVTLVQVVEEVLVVLSQVYIDTFRTSLYRTDILSPEYVKCVSLP